MHCNHYLVSVEIGSLFCNIALLQMQNKGEPLLCRQPLCEPLQQSNMRLFWAQVWRRAMWHLQWVRLFMVQS